MTKSVSNRLTNHKLNLLAGIGVDVNQVLRKSGISQFTLNKSNGRIPYRQHKQFIHETTQYNEHIVTGMSCLNQLYGIFPELFGLCLNAESAVEAMRNFIRYRFIMGDCDDIEMRVSENRLWLEYTNNDRDERSNSSIGHFLFFKEILSHYLPRFSINVSFDNAIPLNGQSVDARFNTFCRYGENRNRMVVTSANLHQKNPMYNPNLYAMQKQLAEQRRSDLLMMSSYSAYVKECIAQSIERKEDDATDTLLDDVCQSLGVSRWTLNGKLNKENTTFSDLLKLVRLEKACSLLVSTEKSISEISMLCRFSSQSAFSKFFRKNNKLSPMQYRDININTASFRG
ncbi:AraC family transcriptional regulator [Vibrio sp. AK197]